MKTIIVGGGASGASCAARLRRLDEKAEIMILEATDEISIANCGLPYYCSDVINDREKILVSNPGTFKNLLNVDVKLNSKVTSIDRKNKKVKINNETEISYDNLVLALGAAAVKPPVKGIDNPKIFTVRTLSDADKIKAFTSVNNIKNAVVVGGGFIGVEMAENFIEMGFNTSLVELLPQILASVDSDIACFAQNEMRDHGCNLILNDGVKVFGENELELNSGRKIQYDIAVLAVGVKPETQIAKDCRLELGIYGSIKVDSSMQTSDKNIYACGDGVEITDFVTNEPALVPLAGPANRQGRIIADNIAGIKSTYKNSQAAAIVKVFNKTIASVGHNEKQLIKNKTDYKKVIIWSNSHAGYYPDSTPIALKLIFQNDGKILGAQGAGFDGVDKRIDVISSIMRLGGTVQNLLDSELCYAPPYSSAKDPVNILGMASDNILRGLVKPAFYEDLKDAYLIDARPAESFQMKTIEGAVSIPATELRSRLNEIPKDKKVILFCAKGFSSYIASRMLTQNGFDNVYSFAGGKMLYDEIVKDTAGILSVNKSEKKETVGNSPDMIKIDACGLQCPGPIIKLASTIKTMKDGQLLEISTTDCGFGSDIEGWCNTTGNMLVNVENNGRVVKAVIQKGTKKQEITKSLNGQTIVVFSNDLDKVLASMIIANGAKASGKDVTLFFTFWGLNVLRKTHSNPKEKSLIDKIFSMMMPKGADKLVLSKMNMFGIGTWMMKLIMKKKNVTTLKELIESAQKNGVKFIACTMSMDIMGIKKEELIDGIEYAGVAKYISESEHANSNLFI
ncbi:MAG: FAD-dependent oxidoreductase [Endomicrobiaceae bacterium]|nr:FAD-dependent oxidoreductase [Endomicrobiaceae bacterium]